MKRCIALVLCIVMLAALLPNVLPHTAKADDRYLEINETNFPDDNFRNWIIGNLPVSGDAETGYYMTEEQVAAVTVIKCLGIGTHSVRGIEHFTELTYLDIGEFLDWDTGEFSYNHVEELDVSKNTALQRLGFGFNQLTTLNVSKNTALQYLYCYDNQLTTLDVSKNTALEILDCGNNQLTTLDMSKNTALELLYCYNNHLTALDVSKNTALQNLWCSSNQLTSLDVSNNTALTRLDCSGNQLSELDVSKNTALEEGLLCHNQLTALDVSNNTALLYLYCEYNQLTALDVSKNTALQYLYCYDNQLTTLDVSKNTALESLNCRYNHLTTLDLSNNTALTEFYADGQTVPDQIGVCTNDVYTFDLTALVPIAYMANVTLQDASNTLDAATGIVTFPGKVESFKYLYATGHGDMDVTVRFGKIAADGQCGDNLYWSFDEETGTLTITGSGDMWDYSWDFNSPWADMCEDITAIELPDGLTHIGNFAFSSCEGLTTISVPEGVTRIGNRAFDGCANLETAVLPESLRTMGFGVFNECGSLRVINLPDGMTDIGDDTFMWCSSLSEAVLPSGITLISCYLFYGSGLRTVTIPVGVKDIYNDAFAWSALTDVYYLGTEEQRAEINIYENNDPLLNAEWHYMEEPSQEHYLEIDAANFPDANFRSWVIENLDVSGDDEDGYYMTEAQVAAVTVIECGNDEIASLQGVEHFLNLEELYCDPFTFSESGALTSVDLSANTKLKVVELGCNHLGSIDVTMLTDLEELSVGFTAITTLDVTQNTKLARLTINATNLTTIDLSQNPLLDWLDLCDAPIPKIDISGCPNMMAYYRAGERELDLPYLQGKHVYGEGNGDVLYNLAFSDGTTVKTVTVQAVALCGETSVGNVAVSPEGIIFPGEQFTLTAPDAEGYTFLGWYDANTDEKLAETQTYTASTQEETVSFVAKYEEIQQEDRYLEINETNFPDDNFRNWIIGNLDVSGDAETGYFMTEEQVAAVTVIECSGLGICSVRGIEHFTELTYLNISYSTDWETGEASYNYVEELDVSNNTALQYLYCDFNQLTTLDLSKNTALQYLYCSKNQLTALDVSKNTALEQLFCANNQLTSLDVSKNTALQRLCCSDNVLTTLNVSKNTALLYLDCCINQLTALDVSKNTALTDLYAGNNFLTALDVSKNTALTQLYADDNLLSALDVSKNAALVMLLCDDNQLTALDVSKNTALETLCCYSNQLTTLDVSKNTALHFLDCSGNQLTTLDLSKNTALLNLSCDSNQLTSLDVSKNTALTYFSADGQTVPDQEGDCANGAYTFDMNKLMSSQQLQNVGFLPDSGITMDSTGIVTLPGRVESFSYQYNAAVDPNGTPIELPEIPGSVGAAARDGESRIMNVTVYLSFEELPTIDGTVEWNPRDVKFKGATPYVIANGSAQTPRFVVKNSVDDSVVDPANYDYEYVENTAPGTGYVIVTFKGAYSGTCRGFFKIYLPATTTTTVANVNNGIKLAWTAVTGADGYVIYRRAWSSTTGGWTDFVRWNNTTDLTWTDTTVYAGTRYQYGVKAYFDQRWDPIAEVNIGGNVGDNFNLGEVGPLKTTVRITTRTLNSVTAGKKQLTVKWGASGLFTGYQVQIATNSAFTQNVKTVKITNAKTAQTVIKSLTSGKTYFVRVRSYHVFNGTTYYGGWSNLLSCKVK